ncbi:MAG: hypothetical protein ACYCSP_14930 [Acidobacteriaceae bacterium]
MEKAILWVLSIVVGGFVGFFSGYTKKKGENRAIHEDFKNVLEQVKETTRATKEIEHKISDAAWDRQKRWELKRDVMIDIANKSDAAKNALTEMHTIYTPQNGAEVNVERLAKRSALFNAWNSASNDLMRVITVASLACSSEVVTAVASFAMFASDLSVEIIDGVPDAFSKNREELASRYAAITRAMRKEIGNDSQPMLLTDVTIRAQAPAPPVADSTPPLA